MFKLVVGAMCVTGGELNLLLRILTSLEAVKQTQKEHSLILQSLLRRGSGGAVMGNEIPDGLNLPLESVQDVDNAEQKLADVATRAALVSQMFLINTSVKSDTKQ